MVRNVGNLVRVKITALKGPVQHIGAFILDVQLHFPPTVWFPPLSKQQTSLKSTAIFKLPRPQLIGTFATSKPIFSVKKIFSLLAKDMHQNKIC